MRSPFVHFDDGLIGETVLYMCLNEEKLKVNVRNYCQQYIFLVSIKFLTVLMLPKVSISIAKISGVEMSTEHVFCIMF